MEKPEDKKWSWILLFLQLWPQWRAIRIIRLLYRNDPRAVDKKKTLNSEITSTEPFLEAWPSVMIMTIIWVHAMGKVQAMGISMQCLAKIPYSVLYGFLSHM